MSQYSIKKGGARFCHEKTKTLGFIFLFWGWYPKKTISKNLEKRKPGNRRDLGSQFRGCVNARGIQPGKKNLMLEAK